MEDVKNKAVLVVAVLLGCVGLGAGMQHRLFYPSRW